MGIGEVGELLRRSTVHIFRQNRRRRSAHGEIQRLTQQTITEQDVRRIGKATLLFHYSREADNLANMLEMIWHHWDNAGVKLVHPLAGHAIPNEIKSGEDKELLEFRIAYKRHIAAVRAASPKFTSNVMTDGFPSSVEYATVKRDISNHASLMHDRAHGLMTGTVSV